jgi:hypothetical protein
MFARAWGRLEWRRLLHAPQVLNEGTRDGEPAPESCCDLSALVAHFSLADGSPRAFQSVRTPVTGPYGQ